MSPVPPSILMAASRRFFVRSLWFAIALIGAAPPAHAVWGDVAKPQELLPFEHVSIVLASQNLRSPVSQFGHSFLVFHNHEFPEPSAIAVEYSGHLEDWRDYVPTLFGAVRGTYSVQYFSYKIRNYDLEDRSYWIYSLNLSAEQLKALKSNLLGEMGRASDYGLFRENCASYLIDQVARAVGRTYKRESILFVTPDATVRWLRHEGLIAKATYQPSLLMRARASYRRLSEDEQAAMRRVTAGYRPGIEWQDPNFQKAISRYVDYRIIRVASAEERELLFELKRSSGQEAQVSDTEISDAIDPSSNPGTATGDATVFGGGRGVQFTFRPGFIGPENQGNYGFANARSEIFNVRIRARGSLRLENLDILNTESFVPGGFLGTAFTQRLTVGYRDFAPVLGSSQKELLAEFGRGTSDEVGPFTLSLLPFVSLRGVWRQGNDDAEARLAGRARIYFGQAAGVNASVVFDRYLNPRLGIAQLVEARAICPLGPGAGLNAIVRSIDGWNGRHEIGFGGFVNF